MLDDLPFRSDLISCFRSLPIMAGLATACLVLIAGRFMQSPRSSRHPFARRHPAVDPFHLFSTERRSWMRHAGRKIDLSVSGDQPDATISGCMVDRSLDGLCVALAQPVKTGITIQVRRTDGPHSAPWVPIHVKHCRKLGEHWILGGQFADQGSCSGMLFE